MPSGDSNYITRLKNSCASFDIHGSSSRSSLVGTLDEIAAELAGDENLRARMGSEDVSLWSDIRKLWRDLVRAQLTFWDGDDDSDTEEIASSEVKRNQSLSLLCVSLARFTRNLVAGVPQNQRRAYENEPELRRLIHYYTSWSSMQDKDALFAARLLTQTLSNLVTGNDALMSNLWETYLSLPEDQVVIIRLLSSADNRTLLAVLVLIKSCINDSRTRTKMLTKTVIGVRICVCLLDSMVKLYEEDENSDGGKAFDVGYHIFTRILEVGLVPDLYERLSIQGEIVTPHQTTLMKIVDSYLQSSPNGSPSSSPKIPKTHMKLIPMLADCFTSLSAYAQNAIRRALRPSPSEVESPTSATFNPSVGPPAELDIMLPKVCETLVLVTQCIVTIILVSRGTYFRSTEAEGLEVFFREQHGGSAGFPENIIELLRLLDKFLPRINFGKPVEPSTLSTASTPTETQPPTSIATGGAGFSYLKRDLDRVRICGGIEVVMNLCVVDERNPYLREHAIFTLHNLLRENPENQAVVEEIKPMGQWDTNGVLRDTPGAVRR
ncbi:ataxin-10-like protein [Moniliophthora roreri]|nr:ataxin-10-like protein [Moniliophthora roreri]